METSLANGAIPVTGGAGFTGLLPTGKLVETGVDSRVTADSWCGPVSNPVTVRGEVDVRPVGLTTGKGRIEATDGVNHVFHLAASVGGVNQIKTMSVGGPAPSALTNQHAAGAARLTGPDRLLFASGACVYRQRHDGLNFFGEGKPVPADPHSTSGWAKTLAERAATAYQRGADLRTSSARTFDCCAPGEPLDPDSSHVIPSPRRKVIAERGVYTGKRGSANARLVVGCQRPGLRPRGPGNASVRTVT